MTVELPEEVVRRWEAVSRHYEGTEIMSRGDTIDCMIACHLYGDTDLARWIADRQPMWDAVLEEGYVLETVGNCICVEDEAGVRAYEHAQQQVGDIDHFRDTWDQSTPFDVHAMEWFHAARQFRATDPDAGKADPDCPYCGGTGKTSHEDAMIR